MLDHREDAGWMSDSCRLILLIVTAFSFCFVQFNLNHADVQHVTHTRVSCPLHSDMIL